MSLTHHDGISVYGSGFYVGRKGSESAMFSDVSGNTNGVVRFDSGIVGASGNILSLSTRLSRVGYAIGQNFGAQTFAAGGIATGSGIVMQMNWSGGAIDIYRACVTGSAATSSQVAWMAWGA